MYCKESSPEYVHFYLGILLRVKPNTTAVPVGTSICGVVLLLIHTAQVPASPCPYEPHMVVGNEHVFRNWFQMVWVHIGLSQFGPYGHSGRHMSAQEGKFKILFPLVILFCSGHLSWSPCFRGREERREGAGREGEKEKTPFYLLIYYVCAMVSARAFKWWEFFFFFYTAFIYSVYTYNIHTSVGANGHASPNAPSIFCCTCKRNT